MVRHCSCYLECDDPYQLFLCVMMTLYPTEVFIPLALHITLYSFNRIDLPNYETYDKLLEKLTFAIKHTTGFHVE